MLEAYNLELRSSLIQSTSTHVSNTTKLCQWLEIHYSLIEFNPEMKEKQIHSITSNVHVWLYALVSFVQIANDI